MVRCLIALGGNIGVSESVFKAAMKQLSRPGIHSIAVSGIKKTKPVGQSAGEEFLNAAATLECELSPYDLLNALHEIEQAFGRRRTTHWGPRTLDLDLCLYGNEAIDDSRLVLPHPAMWYRKFVLDPALDIAADMVHPLLQQSITELHTDLQKRPLRMALRCSETLSVPLNLAAIAQDLPEDAVEWMIPGDSPVDRSVPSVEAGSARSVHGECDVQQTASTSKIFAEVIFHDVFSGVSSRTQPPNFLTRTIPIFTASQQDAVEQLRALRSAVLG